MRNFPFLAGSQYAIIHLFTRKKSGVARVHRRVDGTAEKEKPVRENDAIMSRKKTHAEFVAQMHVVNPLITILGQYENNKIKIKCRCNVCGYEWLGSPSHLLNGHGCRKCADRAFAEKRLWTHEHFLEELSKVNDKVIIKSKYRGAKESIKCECAVCGYTWNSKPAMLLSGRGCRKCGYNKAVETRAANGNPLDTKRRMTQEEFERRLKLLIPM